MMAATMRLLRRETRADKWLWYSLGVCVMMITFRLLISL